MAKKNRPAPAENLRKYIVKGIQEKKGKDIVIIDLQSIKHAICDYFIICTGTSETHVDTIADSVEKEVIEGNKERPWHREGFENKEWILLDYVDIVVHIFKQEVRSHYKLEELWGDAVITRIEDL